VRGFKIHTYVMYNAVKIHRKIENDTYTMILAKCPSTLNQTTQEAGQMSVYDRHDDELAEEVTASVDRDTHNHMYTSHQIH